MKTSSRVCRLRLELHILLSINVPEGLAKWVTIPTTYAGGAKCESYAHNSLSQILTWATAVSDLQLVDELSGGKVDLTFGR